MAAICGQRMSSPTPFEIDAAQDHHDVAHGVEIGEFLERTRGMLLMGVANPERVIMGMVKKKDVIIACCWVAETVEISKSQPQGRENEGDDAERQHAEVSAKGHAEPQGADQRDDGRIEAADEEEGNGFAQDELPAADGRDHDLLERADLPLAHHGEGGQHHDHDQGQIADDAGNEIPAAFQAFVEPRADLRGPPGAGTTTSCGAVRCIRSS